MKQFKKTQVMMLPTNKTANIGANNWYLQKTNTLIINNLISNLYIISNDKIKQNDWCLNISKNIIYQKDNLPMDIMWKKIIATTDKSIYPKCDGKCAKNKCVYMYPQPSQEFIKKYIESYNNNKVIIDVLVEYKTNILYPVIENNNLILKVNSKDNTITIKKLKDSWNREEIKLLIEKYQNTFGTANAASTFVQDWINKNI